MFQHFQMQLCSLDKSHSLPELPLEHQSEAEAINHRAQVRVWILEGGSLLLASRVTWAGISICPRGGFLIQKVES